MQLLPLVHVLQLIPTRFKTSSGVRFEQRQERRQRQATRTNLSDAVAGGVVDGVVHFGKHAVDLKALEAVPGPVPQCLMGKQK